jgi:Cyclic nucleotide-binding domain
VSRLAAPELAPATKSFLASLHALADVPEAEGVKLFALCRPAILRRGEHLLRAGETPRSLAFVEAGLLRLSYLDVDGREFTKSFCAEGEVVAAYSALLLDQPSRLFIESLEDSQLLVADYRAYQASGSGGRVLAGLCPRPGGDPHWQITAAPAPSACSTRCSRPHHAPRVVAVSAREILVKNAFSPLTNHYP